MRVKWTRPANADLKHLQDHIAQDNPRAAFRVASLIREQTGRLSHSILILVSINKVTSICKCY